MSAIREIPRPVIERRADRDDLAVLRHTHTHPAVIIAPLTDHNIRPTRNPQTVGGKIVNTDLSSVDNTAQIVVGCADCDGSTIGGETYAHTASVAGDDFVGGVCGPGEPVVAGEVDGLWICVVYDGGLILSG